MLDYQERITNAMEKTFGDQYKEVVAEGLKTGISTPKKAPEEQVEENGTKKDEPQINPTEPKEILHQIRTPPRY